jgi:hypothetical protein
MMNIWPGKKLYLKTDKSLIGEVVNAETDHRFPDGTMREGVQIRFAADHSVRCVPRETVHRIYVTR